MIQVLVVDMLEGFARCGPLASPRVAALIPAQAAFLESLPRDALIVFACDAHQPDDVELRRFPPHCLVGTKEAEICPELLDAAQRSHARIEIFQKNQFSAFFHTNFGEFVDNQPSKDWIVIGCVTDCCIEANVAEFAYRGCNVTVVRNLADTWDMSAKQAQDASLPVHHEHDATAINRHWFERRLPAIWGATVVDDWRNLRDVC